MSSASRYETVIATLVGVLALLISAYTAYIQRYTAQLQQQQVRAQVYPILQLISGGAGDDFHVMLENKGMGPALLRNVSITLDGKPLHTWFELVERVVGPDKPLLTYSSFGQRTMSAGESLQVLSFDRMLPPETKPGDKPIAPEPPLKSRGRLMESRARWRVSICYCSTLGDCWTLAQSNTENGTRETRRCPEPNDDSFE